MEDKINSLRPKLDIQSAWKAAKARDDYNGTFVLVGDEKSIVLNEVSAILIEELPSGRYRIIKVAEDPRYKFVPGEKGGISVGRYMTLDETKTISTRQPKQYFNGNYAGKIAENELKIAGLKNEIKKIEQKGKAPILQNETNNDNNQESY